MVERRTDNEVFFPATYMTSSNLIDHQGNQPSDKPTRRVQYYNENKDNCFLFSLGRGAPNLFSQILGEKSPISFPKIHLSLADRENFELTNHFVILKCKLFFTFCISRRLSRPHKILRALNYAVCLYILFFIKTRAYERF